VRNNISELKIAWKNEVRLVINGKQKETVYQGKAVQMQKL